MTRSISQLPTNSYSAQTAEVYTATGFNAGDLVYYQNGDYKSQANLTAPSQVPFTVSAPATTYAASVGGITNNLFSGYGNSTGGSRYNMAAILTNGNIVQVMSSFVNKYASWRIVNTSGVVQVAMTNITSPIPLYFNSVGVLALSGGGFVIYWMATTTNQITYAIYSNTGTVVTATTSDSGGTSSSTTTRLAGTALPNGGFVLTIGDGTGSLINFKIYTSTGGATTSWASTTIPFNGRTYGIAARSDSSFIVFGVNATPRPVYIIYSATGTTLVASTVVTSSLVSWALGPVDVAVLADGTTFVLLYSGGNSATNYGATFSFLPSGNVQSAETNILVSNGGYATGLSSICNKIIPQTAGGFAILSVSDTTYMPWYTFFNSSGTCLSGTNAKGAVPIYIPNLMWFDTTYSISPTVLEYGGNLNIYYTPYSNPSSYPFIQYYFQISTTSYQVVAQNPLPISLGNIYSTPSTQYLAGNTPSSLQYYAANTEQDRYFLGMDTSISPQIVTQNNTLANHACTLPNGNFVIAYIMSGSYAVIANVYTPFGGLITSISVGTAGAYLNTVVNRYAVRVCGLSSNKFVVTYPDTSLNSANSSSAYTLTSAMYSTAYILLNSTTTSMFATSQSTTTGVFDCVGISGDRWVIAYIGAGGNVSYTVYNNASIVLQGPATVTSLTSCAGLNIISVDNGGFIVRLGVDPTNLGSTTYFLTQDGASSWSVNTGVMSGTTFYTAANYAPVYANTGCVLVPTAAASTALGLTTYAINRQSILATSSIGTSTAVANAASGALGATGVGTILVATFGSISASTGVSLYGYTMGISANATAYTTTNTLTVTMSLAAAPNMFIIPGYGTRSILTWRDANNFLQYAIYNAFPYNYTTALTSGTTTSAPTSITPSAVTSPNSITNTVLAGVAVTTASAGSTGQIITNGQAVLNTTYPATLAAQSFDYTGQGVSGVKGTIVNRNVNLQGNS